MKTYTILLVEDDLTLSSTLTYHLEQKNWDVTCATTFEEGARQLKAEYDLVILDVNLPDGNGYTLCRQYRKVSENPVIFLTANDMEADSLKGYDLGADDYVTKPFSINIFLKKIEVILKRITSPRKKIYSDGFLVADLEGMSISCGGRGINLSALEFRTLKMFVENSEVVLTRQKLLEKLWDIDGTYVDEHALTMGISRLRKKIEAEGHTYIKTIYGLGYMWVGEKL